MKQFLQIGAVFMLIGVALGAFGAHGLKNIVSPEMLAVWKTGVEYNQIHGLAICLCAFLVCTKAGRLAGWLFAAGIVVFSGSLYLLSVTGVKMLGAITPLGGLCFLLGWVAVIIAAGQRFKDEPN